MRKTGKAKTLLTMLLAAAALQAGTAFGAQATGESQLQAVCFLYNSQTRT